MSKLHPVHTLRANLESARLNAVQALAARGGPISADSVRDLATIQAALTAVEEEIEMHGGKLGWGVETELV